VRVSNPTDNICMHSAFLQDHAFLDHAEHQLLSVMQLDLQLLLLKMMMGFCVEGEAPGLCSRLRAAGSPLQPAAGHYLQAGNKAATCRSKSNFRHVDGVLHCNAHCDKAHSELCRYQTEILQLAFPSLGPLRGQIVGDSVAKPLQKCGIPVLCCALGCAWKIGFRN